MNNMERLPDAWETNYKLSGEEGRTKEGLYSLYYKVSMAIFNYRIKHNLSQKKLAEKLGITQAMVSKLESGDYNYTMEQLWKVASKLGFNFDVIFEEAPGEITVHLPKPGEVENVLQYPEKVVG